MPTQDDAARFSGEVAGKLTSRFEQINVVAPSSEFQGTRQGYWTVRSVRFASRSVVEFAVWPCRVEERHHLGVRLLGGGLQAWPEGLAGHSRQLNSLHISPDTAFHRMMGLLNAQAVALEAVGEGAGSSSGGANAVSDDWISS